MAKDNGAADKRLGAGRWRFERNPSGLKAFRMTPMQQRDSLNLGPSNPTEIFHAPILYGKTKALWNIARMKFFDGVAYPFKRSARGLDDEQPLFGFLYLAFPAVD